MASLQNHASIAAANNPSDFSWRQAFVNKIIYEINKCFL